MLVHTQARADWRALFSAVLLGSGVGLALGGAYLAGGMARTATDHARAARLAQAAIGGFSEAALQQQAADMSPGERRVVLTHDALGVSGASGRERQNVLFAARLERQASFPAPARSGALTPVSLEPALVVSPFRLTGALESSRELDCLTQAVYFEARGETAAGQAAVAQVVLNRVRHPAFPKSVCAVVFQGAARGQGCQFSFACDGSMRRGREMAAWDRARQVAAGALSGGVMALVGDATNFHTTSVSPGWGPNLLRVAQVGLHVFYRFGHGAAPSAYAELSPEMAAQPQIQLATSTPTPELRLASVVIVQGPGMIPGGVGGPERGGLEPASAPIETKGSPAKPSEAAKPAPPALRLDPVSASIGSAP